MRANGGTPFVLIRQEEKTMTTSRWFRILPLLAFCVFATVASVEARTAATRPAPATLAERLEGLVPEALRSWLTPAPASREVARPASRPAVPQKCGGGIDPNGKPCG